jgi:hypothetical protein
MGIDGLIFLGDDHPNPKPPTDLDVLMKIRDQNAFIIRELDVIINGQSSKRNVNGMGCICILLIFIFLVLLILFLHLKSIYLHMYSYNDSTERIRQLLEIQRMKALAPF